MNDDRRADNHPDWNELARLADQGPEDIEPTLLKHLASCAECQAAWAEAVRYRGARVLGTDSYHIPPELAARAVELIGSGARNERPVMAAARRIWRPIPAAALGGGLLAAVLALFILLPGLHVTNGPNNSHTLILAALESQSARGLVYPGVVGVGDPDHPTYRSGTGADAPLQELLDQKYEAWRSGPQSSDETWWLAAGCVAAGRLALASDLIDQSLRSDPDHRRLLHLKAITAWRLSEFDRAEYTLREILVQAPTDSTAMFNLALVLVDSGRSDEATDLLQQLAASSHDSLLRKRALEVLEALGAQ